MPPSVVIAVTNQEPELTPRSILSSIEIQAVRQARATALVWRGKRIPYGELHQMAAHAASGLRALHLPRSRPVGILAEKSPEAVALMLGCWMAGYCFVLPSVELTQTTHQSLFESAGCSVVISPEPGTIRLSVRIAIRKIELSGRPVATELDDVAVILTTSGSTGLPKLVPLSMSAAESFTDWACAKFEIGPGKTVLNYAPLNFDLCFLDIWATLKAGACVVLVDQRQATNGAHLCKLLSISRVQVIQAVPMLYRLLMEASLPDGQRFDSVQHVIFTGDSMPSACLEALPRLFPAAKFYNVYGCTETNDSFIHEPDLSRPPAGLVPIGKPLPGVDALILDEEDRVIGGSGVGELRVDSVPDPRLRRRRPERG